MSKVAKINIIAAATTYPVVVNAIKMEGGASNTYYNLNSLQTKGTKSKGTHDFQAIRA